MRQCWPSPSDLGAKEQITRGTMRGVGGPLVWEVTRPIVNEVAAPAKALQVVQPIVAQIVTEAGNSRNEAGLA